jgi:ADP-heptose:LPS heptosyltransferase
VVSWTGFGNSDFVANLRRISPDAIVASWHPESQDQRHVSRLFIESLRSSAEEVLDTEPKIHLDSDSLRDGIRWLIAQGWKEKERLIAIHPGAGSKRKCWPLERFIDVARRLDFDHYKLLLIEGPAEEGISRRISEALPEGKSVVAGSVPLKLLAAVLKNSRLFIGNDSGLAHLAAALKAPSIVLFGPTIPQHWAPLGSHVTVLHEPLGCRACAAGCGDHTCLLNITVDDVIRSAHRALNTQNHN